MGNRLASSDRALDSRPLSRWWIVAGATAVVACAVELVIWLRLPPPPPEIRNSTQLTHDGLPKNQLAVSADGARLYFTESSSGHARLMTVPSKGGTDAPIQTPLTDFNLLDISAQSELLISSPGAETGEGPLWVVPAASGSPRRLGEILAHDAAWAPDGKLVLVMGNDFYIAGHDGADPRKLASAPGRPLHPRFSPDGSRVRFTIGDPRRVSTMWELKSDGSGMHPVLPLPGWKASPAPCCGAWTPNGEHFVFLVKGDLWIVADRPGTHDEPVQLTSGPVKLHSLVPRKDGKGVFAIGAQPQAELVRYDAPSRQFIPFLGGISAADVDFSRDGQWVTYVSYPEGSLWRSKIDGSEQLRLTSPPMEPASPQWSPDGQRIAFSGWKPGESWRVLTVSKDGGIPEVVTSNNRTEAGATWSPDGNTLAFVTYERPSHIVLLDLNSRTRSEWPDSAGLSRPRWSPDGRFVLALSSDLRAIMIGDSRGKKWQRLAGGFGVIGTATWSHDGKYICLDAATQHDSVYLRVRVSDGKVERIASLKNVSRYWGSWGFWSGLAPGDLPLIALDTSRPEVYALDWQLP